MMLKAEKKKRPKNKIKNTKYFKINELNSKDRKKEILEYRKEDSFGCQKQA